MLAKAVTTGWACIAALVLASTVATSATTESARRATPRLDVSYEPTPQAAVDRMLEMAKVGPGDLVVDLGSGDGRIPITAAKKHGARALGIDLDPRRVKEARDNAEREGVEGTVSFMEGDLFKADLSQATVVTLFLWPSINMRLRPRLLALAPGTRIVSHEHKMGDWLPDATTISSGEDWADLHLWVVPAKIDGVWRVHIGDSAGEAKIEQRFQRFQGSAIIGGRVHRLRNGRISGAQVSFDLTTAGAKIPQRYTGRVTAAGDIEGEGWHARR